MADVETVADEYQDHNFNPPKHIGLNSDQPYLT